ncbi:hypothetical protein ES705_45286 [subsurface metagenome]
MSDELGTEGKGCLEQCHLTVKGGQILAECETIEASQELALLLAKDVFIRVKPAGVTTEPVKPAPEPVTES